MVTIDTTLFITKAGKNQLRNVLGMGGLARDSQRREGFSGSIAGRALFRMLSSLVWVTLQKK
jgi:hypothetical protein